MRSGRHDHVAVLMGKGGKSTFHDGLRFLIVITNMDFPENAVYPDDYQAGKQAVKELAAAGKNRIWYVDTRPQAVEHYSQPARRRGYLEAMAELGRLPRLFELPDSRLEVCRRELWEKQVAAEGAPDAFLCYSVVLAWHMMIAGLKFGYESPRDFAMMAFADHQISTLDLPVSVMRIPFEAVGKHAVEMLLDKIEHGNRDRPSIKLSHEFRDYAGIAGKKWQGPLYQG